MTEEGSVNLEIKQKKFSNTNNRQEKDWKKEMNRTLEIW